MSILPDPLIRPRMPAGLESPSLYRGDNDAPAFETKFVLTEQEAREVQDRLRSRLVFDPHADPALGHAYQVTSVYFDTLEFDVYRRSKKYRRRKFRIRRYGSSSSVYCERKSKREGQVRKRRAAIPLDELPELTPAAPADWAGAWFARQLAKRNLLPVCRVSYQRLALVGSSPDGPMRVTFDRAAVGCPTSSLLPDRVETGCPLLSDEVITEFKFLGAMPAPFKTAIEDLRLTPRSISKFRRCVEAAGLVAAGSGPNG